jgi:hypothetical protein
MLEREQSLIIRTELFISTIPPTLEASQCTCDCLARRADASSYFAMREANVDMCAKVR